MIKCGFIKANLLKGICLYPRGKLSSNLNQCQGFFSPHCRTSLTPTLTFASFLFTADVPCVCVLLYVCVRDIKADGEKEATQIRLIASTECDFLSSGSDA